LEALKRCPQPWPGSSGSTREASERLGKPPNKRMHQTAAEELVSGRG
jgi:hypothetical protein